MSIDDALAPVSGTAAQPAVFKQCPLCRFTWATRESFLGDAALEPIGYQVNFGRLNAGLFLFNHACKGTLAVKASAFLDLYAGPLFETRHTGDAQCPGHCLHTDDLQPCPARCECAYVREILQIIRRWPRS